MAFDYTPIQNRTYNTGDLVYVSKATWSCVIPCVVVGFQTYTTIPVLKGPDGPILNTNELVMRSTLKTAGRPGQTPIEVVTLGRFESVAPCDMRGKTVHVADTICGAGLLVMFEDGCYYKGIPIESWDNSELVRDALTMLDLDRMGLLAPEVCEEHERQRDAKRESVSQRNGEHDLRSAIDALGIYHVKEFVDREISK